MRRYIVPVILWTVAIMSGAMALLRELYSMYSGQLPARPLFWSCLRIAFGASLLLLWVREHQTTNRLEAVLRLASTRPARAPEVQARYDHARQFIQAADANTRALLRELQTHGQITFRQIGASSHLPNGMVQAQAMPLLIVSVEAGIVSRTDSDGAPYSTTFTLAQPVRPFFEELLHEIQAGVIAADH